MKKRIVWVILALFLLAGCGAKEQTPASAVSSLLKAYQSGDKETFEAHLINPETANAFFEAQEADVLDQLIIDEAKKITFKEPTEAINGDEADVTVNIEYPDISVPFTEALGEAMVKAQEEANADPDALLQEIKESVSTKIKESGTKITEDVAVKMKKVEGTWKVDYDNSPQLQNALTGNLAAIAAPTE